MWLIAITLGVSLIVSSILIAIAIEQVASAIRNHTSKLGTKDNWKDWFLRRNQSFREIDKLISEAKSLSLAGLFH